MTLADGLLETESEKTSVKGKFSNYLKEIEFFGVQTVVLHAFIWSHEEQN